MAETELRRRDIDHSRWPGSKFRFAQNLDEGHWASICIEVERRGDQWIITRLDRNPASLPENETGFRVIKEPA